MIVAVTFWTCIIAAVAISGWGLGTRSSRVLLLAAALQVPAAIYLAATPRFRWVGLLIPVPQIISASIVRRSRSMAIILGCVFPAFVVWLVMLAAIGNRGAAV